jgi:hypothetical protein
MRDRPAEAVRNEGDQPATRLAAVALPGCMESSSGGATARRLPLPDEEQWPGRVEVRGFRGSDVPTHETVVDVFYGRV